MKRALLIMAMLAGSAQAQDIQFRPAASAGGGAATSVEPGVTTFTGCLSQFVVADAAGLMNCLDLSSVRLGAVNSATPAAQVITVPGARGGTDTNVAGGNFTLQSGLGTGTGTVSTLIFQTPTVAASGTTAQTAATRLTLSSTVATTTVPFSTTNQGTAALPVYGISSSNARGMYSSSSGNYNGLLFSSGALIQASIAPASALAGRGLWLTSTGGFGWSDGELVNAPDTRLFRHAAGVVRAGSTTTDIKGFMGGGAAVASATALPVPTGRVFHVTGTTTITSITSTNFATGACITMIFDDALTLTDGSNLVLAGDFVTTANDTWSGCYDGSSWFETGRSIN